MRTLSRRTIIQSMSSRISELAYRMQRIPDNCHQSRRQCQDEINRLVHYRNLHLVSLSREKAIKHGLYNLWMKAQIDTRTL